MRRFSYRKILITAAAAAVVLVSFSALVLLTAGVTRRKLGSEINEKNIKIDELYSIVSEYGADINELRKKLLLPEKVYLSGNTSLSGTPEADEQKSGNTENNEDLPFYLAADKLIAFNLNLQNMKQLKEYITGSDFESFIKKYGLSVSRYRRNGYKLVHNGNTYYTIELIQEKPASYRIAAGNSSKKMVLVPGDGFTSAVGKFISETFDSIDSFFLKSVSIRKSLMSLGEDVRIRNILHRYNLKYTVTNSGKSLSGTVKTSDGRTIAGFSFDENRGIIALGTSEYDDFDLFRAGLLKTLEDADKRTAAEMDIDKARNKIVKIAGDPVFKKYLENRGLVLLPEVREDSDYYYFDFVDTDGKKQGALGVQKHIGEIYLFDSEDIVISSLKTISIGTEENNDAGGDFVIPENIGNIKYQYGNSMNLLLIGSHEKNADTIILANFNEDENKIRLISIPRDLYYRNRKINDYYRTGGGEVFSRIISDITGVTITGYIGVDMYAFIDLINILGGIDVELKQDLTDPTYKVRDDGVWTTLHYSRGMHHLNGIEALRIARSRHTSSDFGRSDRQQLIIKGLKDKLNDLKLSDMNKLYSIFRTAAEYLDTNMSSVELISVFLKYRNADIEKKDGLSVFNVLYNTYSNIYMLKDKSRQYDEGFNRGAWILLPRNNDWNVIKWYINKLLNE